MHKNIALHTTLTQVQLRHTLGQRADVINTLAWSPDGLSLASGMGDGTIRVWDIKTGSLLHTLEGHTEYVRSVAWSPDGCAIASGADDKSIRLWDVQTGKTLQILEGHSHYIRSVAWSPDGRRLASGAYDKAIRLWDVRTGMRIRTLEGHTDWVLSVTWSPDSRKIASGSEDRTLRIWNAKTGEVDHIISTHTALIRSVAWSPDGRRLASGADDRTVSIWDVETGKSFRILNAHTALIRSVAWSPDGRRLASGADDRTVSVWDVETGDLLHILQGHTDYVRSVAWSPDGRRLASGAYDRTIRLWDTQTGKLLQMLEVHANYIRSIAWSPDGRRLASGAYDGVIRIWDAETGEPSQIISAHTALIRSVAWSPDGRRLASGAYDGVIRIWDAETGDLLHTLQGHTDYVRSVAWSPDGRRLASGAGDRTLRIWDAETGKPSQIISAHTAPIRITAWSPDGKMIASGSNDNTVCIWNAHAGNLLFVLEGHTDCIRCLIWSPDSCTLASGAEDRTIHLWDIVTGRLCQILEGHTDYVLGLGWSPDGRMLVSASDDGSVRIWRTDLWATVKVFDRPASKYLTLDVSFHPVIHALHTLGAEDLIIRTWELDANALLRSSQAIASINYTSAKIILVGESGVGKSCLAVRLAENRYEEQSITHGMRTWTIPFEQMSGSANPSIGEKRDIILWDMGGQDEYRLVHQLFLHDTTLALILFEPRRGRIALEEVKGWNLRLEKQLHGRKTIKVLIGTKLDDESFIVDRKGLDELIKGGEFVGYYPVSSKSGSGIAELRTAISDVIDWGSLAKISRPSLFQRILDEIESKRRAGEFVLFLSDLEEQILSEDPIEFDARAIQTVVDQLAMQGIIADTWLGTKDRVLVLQINQIERYAGSLIIAARNNPRGVPALEGNQVVSAKMSFPGIEQEDRLQRSQERIILECVVQLLLSRGICFKHEGLLIFPSLFRAIEQGRNTAISHSISLYYDFSGAIDNIYSSLVVQLAISGRFGRVRLGEDRAEFDQADEGVCGLYKVGHLSGLAHLDLFFSPQTTEETRELFIIFVEEHLHKEGVSITEVLEVTCVCGFRFQESSLRRRLAEGFADIICPECEARSQISEGAKAARANNPETEENLLALKTVIDKKSKEALIAIKQAFVEGQNREDMIEPFRILHLSDLHLNANEKIVSKLQPLIKDLEDTSGGLGFRHLDYLVVTGDLTNRATTKEFDKAYEFVSELIGHFKLTAERCIIIPGNHDLSWDEKVYDWKQERLVEQKSLTEGSYVQKGDVYLIRDEKKYPKRFDNFAKFYHSLFQEEYPLKFEEQCIPFLFNNTMIQFLAMNSAWETDEFFPSRSSINESALSRALIKADEQIHKAKSIGQLPNDALILRIAICHHPVTGNDKIFNDSFLELLRQSDAYICLHGHVHEDRADLVGYIHHRRIHIVGAGSFGAPVCARPESMPRLYNVLEVAQDRKSIRVHTRCLRKRGGAWEGWAVWPGPIPTEKRTYYEIRIP